MSPERLFTEILRTYGKDATAGPELAQLTNWYLGELATVYPGTDMMMCG